MVAVIGLLVFGAVPVGGAVLLAIASLIEVLPPLFGQGSEEADS